MSLKQLGAITNNTLIPVSLVIGLVSVAVWLGSLASDVKAITVKDSPSRAEFNSMCEQLSSIQKGVNDINIYLRDKK